MRLISWHVKASVNVYLTAVAHRSHAILTTWHQRLLAIIQSDNKYNSNDHTHLTTRIGTDYRTNAIQRDAQQQHAMWMQLVHSISCHKNTACVQLVHQSLCICWPQRDKTSRHSSRNSDTHALLLDSRQLTGNEVAVCCKVMTQHR